MNVVTAKTQQLLRTAYIGNVYTQYLSTNLVVPGRNQTLFRWVFRLHYIRTTLVQSVY